MPAIKGADSAFRKRVLVIPFEANALAAPYRSEQLSGDDVMAQILCWLIAGYKMSLDGERWRRIRGSLHDATEEALSDLGDAYPFMCDGDWLAADDTAVVTAREALDLYRKWRIEHNEGGFKSDESDQFLGKQLSRGGWRIKQQRVNGKSIKVRIGFRPIAFFNPPIAYPS